MLHIERTSIFSLYAWLLFYKNDSLATALITRAEGLYERILTEVVSTDQTAKHYRSRWENLDRF